MPLANVPKYPGVAPPRGAMVNPGNALADRMLGCWVLPSDGSPPVNAVDGAAGTPNGSGIVGAQTPYGAGQTITGASWYDLGGYKASYQPALPISFLVVCKLNDITTNANGGLIMTENDSGQNFGCRMSWTRPGGTFFNGQILNNGGGASTNRRNFQGSTGLATGIWYTVTCSIRDLSDATMYVNNLNQTMTYNSTGTALLYDALHGGPQMGAYNQSSGLATAGVLVIGAIWARSLSDAEHMALAANPFAMFESPNDRQVFAKTAPVAGTINAPFKTASESFYSPSFVAATPISPLQHQSVSIDAS